MMTGAFPLRAAVWPMNNCCSAGLFVRNRSILLAGYLAEDRVHPGRSPANIFEQLRFLLRGKLLLEVGNACHIDVLLSKILECLDY